MFCANCGKKIPDNAKFCPDCGFRNEGMSSSEFDDSLTNDFSGEYNQNEMDSSGFNGDRTNDFSGEYNRNGMNSSDSAFDSDYSKSNPYSSFESDSYHDKSNQPGTKNQTITISMNTSPMQILLTVLALAGSGYFIYEVFAGIGGIVSSVGGMFGWYSPLSHIFWLIGNILGTVAALVMVLALLSFALFRKPANMRSLFTIVGVGAILYILVQFLHIIMNSIGSLVYGYSYFDTYSLLKYIATGLFVIAAGCVFLLADGYRIYAGKTAGDISVILQRSVEDLSEAWKAVMNNKKAADDAQQKKQRSAAKASFNAGAYGSNGQQNANNYANAGSYRNGNGSANGYANPNGNMNGNGYANPDGNMNGNGYANPYTGNAGFGGNQPYPGAGRVKDDRSFLLYLVLNVVTCGIYSLFFFHDLAKDINTICEGDGRSTAGLLKMIIFSCLTCGIYSYVWYYKAANRMQSNAPRYGIYIRENGSTYLLWTLVGLLLCGIGPFIALYNIFKAINDLAAAYNRANGYMY